MALYRLLARLVIGAVALAAAALFFQPWALVDPVDRFIHLSGPSRSMVPEVFAAGEPMAAVVERLTQAGYAHSAIERAVETSATCGNSRACDRIREGFTDFFRKPNMAFNIACSLDHVVWIKRDADRVVSALSDVYDTCL